MPHAIPVRRASALPAASFRFHLAVDTLAVRLTIPPVGLVGDFHPQVSAPCRAHTHKKEGHLRDPPVLGLTGELLSHLINRSLSSLDTSLRTTAVPTGLPQDSLSRCSRLRSACCITASSTALA